MRFGKRVVGEKQWKEQEQAHEEAKKRGFKFGPRVTGGTVGAPKISTKKGPKAKGPATSVDQLPTPEPATTKQPAPTTEPKPQHILSVADMQEVLKGEVSEQLLDELIAAEFERPEGEPRKGALRLLVQAEQARGDAARPAIVQELQRALGG